MRAVYKSPICRKKGKPTHKECLCEDLPQSCCCCGCLCLYLALIDEESMIKSTLYITQAILSSILCGGYCCKHTNTHYILFEKVIVHLAKWVSYRHISALKKYYSIRFSP